MNSKNYFKTHVVKFHRDNLITSMHNSSKQKINFKTKEEKRRKQIEIF